MGVITLRKGEGVTPPSLRVSHRELEGSYFGWMGGGGGTYRKLKGMYFAKWKGS